jgi:UPF0716 protein FxsA
MRLAYYEMIIVMSELCRMRFFLIGLLLLPIIEIWGLISVGSHVGVLPVVLWVIAMIFVGMQLLRITGALGAINISQSLRSGKLPGSAISTALIRGCGAVLLIIPGFVSDVLAVICFVPGINRLLMLLLAKKFANVSAAAYQHSVYRRQSDGNVFEHEESTEVAPDHYLPTPPESRSKNNQKP